MPVQVCTVFMNSLANVEVRLSLYYSAITWLYFYSACKSGKIVGDNFQVLYSKNSNK